MNNNSDVQVQRLLDQQDQIANRLRHLNQLVNSLMQDDCTKHEHTINHYLSELMNTRKQAQALNDQVQLYMDELVKSGKLERF